MTIFSTSGCDSPMVGASLQENLASDEKKKLFSMDFTLPAFLLPERIVGGK
jgi:hypothetical protein